MTLLDWFLVLLIGIGLVQGYASGFIKQAASLVGIVAGLAFAVTLMTEVGLIAARSLGISARVAPVVGFLLVFGVVQLVVFVLARTAESVLGVVRLTVLNRAAGAAVGALKAALLVSVLLVPLGHVGVPREEARAASFLYEPVARLMPAVWGVAADQIPRMNHLRAQFDASARALRNRLARD